MAIGAIDPVVGCICGRVPFRGPFAIGHECVAEVVSVGAAVEHVRGGQVVIVPWAVSCGTCARCSRGLTSKCETTTQRTLAAFGFGPASGPWGGMVADTLRVPYADHMLVQVPPEVPPERVAAGSDNLADAWRSVVPPLQARLPDLLAFIARTQFPAERVTTLTADWDDAPRAYTARTTKVVLQRDRTH